MWHMADGWGWWFVFGWLWMLAFWGLIVWAVVYLVSRLGGRSDEARAQGDALAVLKMRYARGELSDDEYEEKRRRLVDDLPRPGA
ncbi:MAG: SHOCT domain-containing protein [Dehalococcoidia bacterium]